MEKITELTAEQKAKFPEYIDRFIKIGLCCDPADRPKVHEGIIGEYKMADLEPPAQFFWVDSPYMLSNISPIAAYLTEKLEERGLVQMHPEENNAVHTNLFKLMKGSVKSKEIADAISRIVSNVCIQRKVNIDTLRSVVDEMHTDDILSNHWYKYIGGQYWVGWLASAVFIQEQLGVDVPVEDRMKSSGAGWWWPHKYFCVVCERPLEIHMKNNQLHNETGPAIQFRDNWSICCLNGVRVPRWLVETPSEQLKAKKIHEIDNAEVRREFVRKIGSERLCHELKAKKIDKKLFTNDTGEHLYELMQLDNGHGAKWSYVKMSNPSMPEIWHVEGVPNDCTTIDQAMNFRNDLKEEQIDDTNGVEWYQQGDVILRPRGAEKFKRFPIQLY